MAHIFTYRSTLWSKSSVFNFLSPHSAPVRSFYDPACLWPGHPSSPRPPGTSACSRQLPYLIYRYWVHGSELYVTISSYLEYGGCVPAARFKITRPAVTTPSMPSRSSTAFPHSGHHQPALQQYLWTPGLFLHFYTLDSAVCSLSSPPASLIRHASYFLQHAALYPLPACSGHRPP